MAQPGDRVENASTGERVVFRVTSAETGGAAVVIETVLRPYARGHATHLHPTQEERFEVLSGSVGVDLGRQRLVAGPGHRLMIPSGIPHRVWNPGEDEASYVSELRPALGFEELLGSLSVLADRRAGRLRRAVVDYAYLDTARRPSAAPPVQGAALAAAAFVGRLLGYPSVYNLSKENLS